MVLPNTLGLCSVTIKGICMTVDAYVSTAAEAIKASIL